MDANGFGRFRGGLERDCEVGFKAKANSKYFYDQIAEYISNVRVINALKFKIIGETIKKTDREDARAVA